MNDVFSKLYADIAEHIQQNMPEIVWIDLYLPGALVHTTLRAPESTDYRVPGEMSNHWV